MKPARDVLALDSTVPSASGFKAAKSVGERLRKLRVDRRLTIIELAARSGVSAGMISQIERDSSSPSVKTLQRLGAAFDLSLWELFDGPESGSRSGTPCFVRLKSERPRLVVGETLLVKEQLSPNQNDKLHFVQITMPPRSFSEEVIVGVGQKAGLILSGTVDLTVGGRCAILRRGDSFQFGSQEPHLIANNSGEESKLVWIISVVDAHS